LVGELFGVFEHLLDFFLRKSALLIGNDHILSITSTSILGVNVHNTICVDLKGNLNLGYTSWGRWNSGKIKFTQEMVVLHQRSFSFKDRNCDGFLLVLIGCKCLRFFCGDRGLLWNNSCHNTTDCLNTKTQRRGINQDHIRLSFSTENTTLHGCSISDGLIGVDTGVGEFPVEEVFDHLLDFWDSGGTSD
jgi:hypothetical protein